MVKKYDLIVVGGGLAGVAATVSAAREGLRVLLIEKSGCLGGAMSNCLVFPFMPFWTQEGREKRYLSTGLFSEMRDRQRQYDPTLSDGAFSPEYFKILLDDMILECGAEVLFHACLYGAETSGRELRSIHAAVKSGSITLEADFFLDATGDGDLLAFAGCGFQLGRESDQLCQPMTTCFRMNGVDIPRFRQEVPRLQELYKQGRESGEIQNPREDILFFPGIGEGILHFNTTRIVKCDPTDPFAVSKAEQEARQQIREMVTFLKKHSAAFQNSALISIATDIGVRESRKLKGEHILTAEELKACTRFPDSIALGNYDIDIHNPEGTGTSHYYFPAGQYYTIPYRSLLPKEYDNLLAAGRCISATHEAQASIRIMPICCCLGEAAGTAVGLAHRTGQTTKTIDISALQQRLIQNGASL